MKFPLNIFRKSADTAGANKVFPKKKYTSFYSRFTTYIFLAGGWFVWTTFHKQQLILKYEPNDHNNYIVKRNRLTTNVPSLLFRYIHQVVSCILASCNGYMPDSLRVNPICVRKNRLFKEKHSSGCFCIRNLLKYFGNHSEIKFAYYHRHYRQSRPRQYF